jgi:ATP-dependent RNA helicase RhlE
MSFAQLNLIEPLLRAVASEGYTEPTPIQLKAIPHLLAGRDLVGCAQTGTGKTAAFALPILQRLSAQPSKGHTRPVRVLILTPTRELASQIGASFAVYGRHLAIKHTVIFGGVGQDPQVRAVRAGVDIVVATPGRLLDLIHQKHVRLDRVEVFILDEGDRMLDMGFIHDVRRIVAELPRQRQTMLFSATMPEEIRALASSILRDPVRVEVAPISSTADQIEQSVHYVSKADKRSLLVKLLGDAAITRALVFTRTKHGANRVSEQLEKSGINAAAIHGNKSQTARERALDGFKRGDVRVLVATDIAARGIDVDGISHVFNFDLPEVPEQYVHRIGRTARAGASGIAISFCDQEERPLLADIERLIRYRLTAADKVTLAAMSDDNIPSPRAPASRESHRPQQIHSGRRRSSGRPHGLSPARKVNSPRW